MDGFFNTLSGNDFSNEFSNSSQRIGGRGETESIAGRGETERGEEEEQKEEERTETTQLCGALDVLRRTVGRWLPLKPCRSLRCSVFWCHSCLYCEL